jgi:hypothetical protein
LQFSAKDVIKKTEDGSNDLVVLRAEAGKPLRYLISSVWAGEARGMMSTAELERFQKRTAARLNEPLVVRW